MSGGQRGRMVHDSVPHARARLGIGLPMAPLAPGQRFDLAQPAGISRLAAEQPSRASHGERWKAEGRKGGKA